MLCLQYGVHHRGTVCAGMLNLLVGALVNVLCCRYKWGSYSEMQYNGIQPPTPATSSPSASTNPIYNNSPSALLTEPVHLVAGSLPSNVDTWWKLQFYIKTIVVPNIYVSYKICWNSRIFCRTYYTSNTFISMIKFIKIRECFLKRIIRIIHMEQLRLKPNFYLSHCYSIAWDRLSNQFFYL